MVVIVELMVRMVLRVLVIEVFLYAFQLEGNIYEESRVEQKIENEGPVPE